MDGEERSGSGAPIHRHEHAAQPEFSGGDPALIEAIVAHVERHLGTPQDVWHQQVSPYVHVDIHVVPPTADRPFFTLVTSGMSEKPMHAPDGDPELSYAELVMALPESWPLTEERGRWPLELLQGLAELPHEYETWLWYGHTVPNGDPPKPYARGTSLSGVLLATPLLVPDEFDVLEVGERRIHFLAVVPLHADEMQLKLDRGLDALLPLLERAEVTEGLVAERPSVVGRRRRFGFGRR